MRLAFNTGTARCMGEKHFQERINFPQQTRTDITEASLYLKKKKNTKPTTATPNFEEQETYFLAGFSK